MKKAKKRSNNIILTTAQDSASEPPTKAAKSKEIPEKVVSVLSALYKDFLEEYPTPFSSHTSSPVLLCHDAEIRSDEDIFEYYDSNVPLLQNDISEPSSTRKEVSRDPFHAQSPLMTSSLCPILSLSLRDVGFVSLNACNANQVDGVMIPSTPSQDVACDDFFNEFAMM